MTFEVEFYETASGEVPVRKFLDSLNPKMIAKIVGLMELLEEKGTSLREPYSKYLEDGIMTLNEYKNQKMKDPEFVKAYDEIEPEMSVIRAMVNARTSKQLSQKELAKITGIQQSEISRLENGTRNPSIRLLQRLADGMGMVLKISFEPKTKCSR